MKNVFYKDLYGIISIFCVLSFIIAMVLDSIIGLTLDDPKEFASLVSELLLK